MNIILRRQFAVKMLYVDKNHAFCEGFRGILTSCVLFKNSLEFSRIFPFFTFIFLFPVVAFQDFLGEFEPCLLHIDLVILKYISFVVMLSKKNFIGEFVAHNKFKIMSRAGPLLLKSATLC